MDRQTQLRQVKEQYRKLLEQAMKDNEPKLLQLLEKSPELTLSIQLLAQPMGSSSH